MLPVFFGLSGLRLRRDETAFFTEARPAGFILFARNVESPGQLRALTDALRALMGEERLAILIDQEGGRVARLRPPHWRPHPPARAYGQLYGADEAAGLEAARLGARVIAAELMAAGLSVNCLPVLDVPQRGADPVIGERAYGGAPDMVAALGRAAARGLLAGGIVPVMKHIPGHGRAHADSHQTLPVVDTPSDVLQRVDFAPFRALAEMPMAMTAHVLYRALDPEHCATMSTTIIRDVIREQIGFAGLLVSDDIAMGALSGPLPARAAGALAAGCDIVLHCTGDMTQMRGIAEKLPAIAAPARVRLSAAMARPTYEDDEEPIADMAARRDALLASVT
ncbi:MAG: beta-N-acetylhexosaminidase [Pseudomonadota bacterium]